MELQAALHSIHISSPDPLAAARFYGSTYDMELAPIADGYRCIGPGRELKLSSGPANRLKYVHFALHSASAWEAFAARVQDLEHRALPDGFANEPQAIGLQDPDGNLAVFTPPAADPHTGKNTGLPPVTLQHLGLRTANLPDLLAFYTGKLGFVLSDAVRDPQGALRACFLRSDNLHHSLALFYAPVAGFDHQSFEAPDWDSMKVWGDRMAALQVPIVWGIGRHGPGNDVFFMVRDPDGNLAEISAEIEHCAPGRPAGLWPHEERTLNLWGKAILRS